METRLLAFDTMRARLAVALAAGAIALGATGCSTPDTLDNLALARGAGVGSTAQPMSFDSIDHPVAVDPDNVDQLPLVEEYVGDASANDFIDTTHFNVAVDDEPRSLGTESSYKQLYNVDASGDKWGDRLPDGASAPILDVFVNSAGKLVYKDRTPADGVSAEDAKLLNYVGKSADALKVALKSGDVGAIHFRVNDPQGESNRTQAQFVPVDYNDHGRPSIYFQMGAVKYVDAKTVDLEIGHELIHAMLGQGKEGDYTQEDVLLLNQACVSLRDNALQTIYRHSSGIVDNLRTARSVMKREYRPAMDKVIAAVQSGTYDSLALSDKRGVAPNCYAQLPWDAYLAAARAEGLKEIGDPFKSDEMSQMVSEEAMSEATNHWDVAAKQSEVFRALSESTYLPPSVENQGWGHAYENTDELAVTVVNLILSQPGALGENVAKLYEAQKASILKIGQRDIEVLVRRHADDRAYCEYVKAQFGVFKATAGVR